MAEGRAADGAFGPARAGPCRFSDMCRGAQAGPDVGKPAADSPGGQGPGGIWAFFPGTAQVRGEVAGKQQLSVRGHDQAGPPVSLAGGADFRGC